MKKPVLLLAMMCWGLCIGARTYYDTRYNNFDGLNRKNQLAVNGNYLQPENGSTTDVIIASENSVDAFVNYQFYMRFANLHNKEGKSYKVTGADGVMRSVTSPECGIVFNCDGQNYWLVTASCSNTNLYDESLDRRSMTISLVKISSGVKKVVKQVTLDKGVDLYDGYNYVGVNVDGDLVKVLAGEKSLNEVIRYQLTAADKEMTTGTPQVKVGCYLESGAKMSIERAVLKVDDEKKVNATQLETQWTREALDRHFEASKNPFEGYWTYLDRDMEDKWLKLGGRYTIALVETEKGYDVIYVDGAQVKKQQWHLGMKKGEMTSTIFTDNFTGKWNDATLESIDEDVYATFESGVILTFKFPVYKSQVRFSKVLK